MTTTQQTPVQLNYAGPEVFEKLKQLTGRIGIVLGLSAALSAIAAVLIVFQLASPATDTTAAFGLLGRVNGIVGLVLVVGFLMWCFKAAKSAEALTRTKLQHSPASAVWWWFVPVANLFKPFSALREIAQPAGANLSAFDRAAALVGPAQALFCGYVLLFVAGFIAIMNLAMSLPMNRLDEIDTALLPNALMIGANLAWTGCCVVLILFTRRTTEAHELLA